MERCTIILLYLTAMNHYQQSQQSLTNSSHSNHSHTAINTSRHLHTAIIATTRTHSWHSLTASTHSIHSFTASTHRTHSFTACAHSTHSCTAITALTRLPAICISACHSPSRVLHVCKPVFPGRRQQHAGLPGCLVGGIYNHIPASHSNHSLPIITAITQEQQQPPHDNHSLTAMTLKQLALTAITQSQLSRPHSKHSLTAFTRSLTTLVQPTSEHQHQSAFCGVTATAACGR